MWEVRDNSVTVFLELTQLRGKLDIYLKSFPIVEYHLVSELKLRFNA